MYATTGNVSASAAAEREHARRDDILVLPMVMDEIVFIVFVCNAYEIYETLKIHGGSRKRNGGFRVSNLKTWGLLIKKCFQMKLTENDECYTTLPRVYIIENILLIIF